MHVTVRELKNHLSDYLRRVSRGEALVVTSHKRPVARLLPPDASESQRAGGVREMVQRTPWARWNGGKPRGLSQGVRLRPGAKTAADVVLAGRR